MSEYERAPSLAPSRRTSTVPEHAPQDFGSNDQQGEMLDGQSLDDGSLLDLVDNDGGGDAPPLDLPGELTRYETAIRGYLAPDVLRVTGDPLRAAVRRLAQAQQSLEMAPRRREANLPAIDRAVQDIAQLEQSGSDPEKNPLKKRREDLAYYRREVEQAEAILQAGLDPDLVTTRDDCQTAHDDFMGRHQEGFEQAAVGLQGVIELAEEQGLDDLIGRARALQVEAIRKRQMRKDVQKGTMFAFGEEMGLGLERPEAIVDPDTAIGDLDGRQFTHVSYAIERNVPGREGFVSVDENRQIDHEVGDHNTAWRGETPQNVQAQIATLLARLDDAYTSHLLQVQALKAENPQFDESGVLSVFVGPEWFFGFVRVYTAGQKQQVVDAIVDASKRYPNLLIMPGTILWSPDNVGILNTLPVVLDGVLLRESSKKRWGGDSSDKTKMITDDHPSRRQFVRREDESPFLQIGNLDIAIDICQDHYQAKAKMEMYSKLNPGTGTDLHIITSSGQSLNDYGVTSREGGYALHSDADRAEGEFKVKKVQPGSTHDNRILQDTGDHSVSESGLVTSNEPLEIDQTKDLGQWSVNAPKYKSGKKDGYKKLGTTGQIDVQKTTATLEQMLAYAEDHLAKNKQARKKRVDGMLAKADFFGVDGSRPYAMLARRVAVQLRRLTTFV